RRPTGGLPADRGPDSSRPGVALWRGGDTCEARLFRTSVCSTRWLLIFGGRRYTARQQAKAYDNSFLPQYSSYRKLDGARFFICEQVEYLRGVWRVASPADDGELSIWSLQDVCSDQIHATNW